MNLQQRAMMAQQMNSDPEGPFLRELLERMRRGATTTFDADWLIKYLAEQQEQTANLVAVIDDAIEFELPRVTA